MIDIEDIMIVINDPVKGHPLAEIVKNLIEKYGREQWEAGHAKAVQDWEKSSFNPWRDDES